MWQLLVCLGAELTAACRILNYKACLHVRSSVNIIDAEVLLYVASAGVPGSGSDSMEGLTTTVADMNGK
jgi:hypothetical protein